MTLVLVGPAGRSAPTTTGTDGLFYFIDVPEGCYTLQVWLGSDSNPTASFPNSCVKEPLTDLPAVQLAF